MKNWKIVLAVLVIVFIIAGAIFLLNGSAKKNFGTQKGPTEDQMAVENYHSALHLDENFYGSLSISKIGPLGSGKIYGGITSHHFLVSKKISKFFSSFSGQSPKTVVIIGPNHYNVGKSDILISKYPYKTPWGWLQSDNEIIDKLLKEKIAVNEENPFSREHSISALVGFIKYHLPESKIIPIILKRDISKEKSQDLAEKLNKALPDDSVVIASVDFSHHLSNLASKFHDQKSIAAVSNFDCERIYQSEIDSPGSICALEKYLELKNAGKIDYENINSAEFLKNPDLEDVTSYLFAHFSSGMPKKNDAISVLNLGNIYSENKSLLFSKRREDALKQIAGTENNFFKGVDFIFFSQENRQENGDYYFKKYGMNRINDVLNGSGHAVKNVGEKKIGFLEIDLNQKENSLEEYYSATKELEEESDYVLADIKWPSKNPVDYFEKQREISQRLVENGADVIIGHLPGEMQPMEIYQEKAIFYSLGDLISSKNGRSYRGMGIGLVFGDGKEKFYIFPYKSEKGEISFLKKDEFSNFCNNYLNNVENKELCYFEK